MKIRLSVISSMCLLSVLLAAAPAFSANVVVGACMPNRVSYDSLTDAVQGVPPGSTIQVCPGTYAEQVVIDKSLTLKGITSGNGAYPVIVPPPGGLALIPSAFGDDFAAQVVVEGGVNVTITGLALDATGFSLPNCFPSIAGISVVDSSATLTNLAVKNQRETGPPPCPSAAGVGVVAMNDTAVAQTIKVQDSTFVNIDTGFWSFGAANTSIITNNSFAGNPASIGNGVLIVSGNASIQGNTITDFSFPPAGLDLNNFFQGIGVFVEACGGTVANNHVSNSRFGIVLTTISDCPTAGLSITGNDVSGASVAGIEVNKPNGLVQGNNIRTSLNAIRLGGAGNGNTIQNNTINDAACAAFSSNPAAGANTLLNNKIFNALNLAIVSTTATCP